MEKTCFMIKTAIDAPQIFEEIGGVILLMNTKNKSVQKYIDGIQVHI